MSYTSPSQLLHDRIDRFIDSMDVLDAAMKARVDDVDEWKDSHIEELGEFIEQFASWRTRLRQLQGKTR